MVEWRTIMADILVVDDDDVIRDTLCELLSTDYSCQTAQTAEEALARLAAQSFDGVFTDVGMPGMSGWELAREIRQVNKQIPIAVITGWGEAVGSHEQKAAGVDWVIAKPFTADRIAELVHEIDARSTRPKSVAIVAA